MKSKKLKMKLNVKKETIAKLNTNELNVVKGGETEQGIPSILCTTDFSFGICTV